MGFGHDAFNCNIVGFVKIVHQDFEQKFAGILTCIFKLINIKWERKLIAVVEGLTLQNRLNYTNICGI